MALHGTHWYDASLAPNPVWNQIKFHTHFLSSKGFLDIKYLFIVFYNYLINGEKPNCKDFDIISQD